MKRMPGLAVGVLLAGRMAMGADDPYLWLEEVKGERAMKWVEAVNHPNFKCLVDSYHFWLEDEPLKNLESAMPSIAHVHVADKAGRVAPGESGKSDYAPFFRVLREGGYDRRISVEAPPFTEAQYGKVLEFLKEQWKDS